MSHLETHRIWYFGAPSESDSWLCVDPEVALPSALHACGWDLYFHWDTEQEHADHDAVLNVREAASCSWM